VIREPGGIQRVVEVPALSQTAIFLDVFPVAVDLSAGTPLVSGGALAIRSNPYVRVSWIHDRLRIM
jgi:hypothetical protein